jgi:hypothetical protein
VTPKQAAALAELQSKSLQDIQIETAVTWAHRAWAARQLGLVLDAVDYEHEAIEHAALSCRDDVLALVRQIIEG